MKQLSPKIIRNWFDTIFNPMVEGLEIEMQYLKEKNLTWRSFNNTFDMLKPLVNFTHPKYHANFEQIVVFHKSVLDTILLHDNELKKLNDSCYNLFYKLMQSKSFDKFLSKKFENNHKSKEVGSLIAAESDKEHFKRYIIEYIINNIDKLDSSYVISPIWNPNVNEFKNFLKSDEFNLEKKQFDNSIKSFDKTLNESKKILTDVRNKLSLEFGEPLVILVND
ncbi:MAG: hypothetical protein A2X61_07080 [Ignavibacteria bacterium GWB2_35_12]|nr:MAG: hypothetical protein A2X61_07080 [Ignavibacteria bacterium GWB2_35_12]OGU88687.1 MAG: hypothetical protein A2220_00530 [Ignavibacteria bacterium RIFOXYA2_FULL_35_10]OGV23259.1 MAG: hypothetical protein A2475_13475 [Ignavibacteria bacterium RIFOXYC2_FULL_35_21]